MTIVSALTTTNWFPIGPAPIDAPNVGLGFAAGRIEAAAPDPSNNAVMYVGANNGGVWKTGVWNNDPPTWLSLGDDQRSLNFAGYHPLRVHPAQASLVLGVVCGPGAGLLKSTNGGLGWQLLGNGLFEGAAIGSLAVHPTNTNVIYLSVWYGGPGGGVYKSTDGGQNWTTTTAGINGAVHGRGHRAMGCADALRRCRRRRESGGLQDDERRRKLESPLRHSRLPDSALRTRARRRSGSSRDRRRACSTSRISRSTRR